MKILVKYPLFQQDSTSKEENSREAKGVTMQKFPGFLTFLINISVNITIFLTEIM